MSAPSGWEGILDDDEEIRWQGQPDGVIRMDLSQPMGIGMGLFFMGFSIVWMNLASRAGGVFWMFGLLFFGIGFYNAIGVHFWKTYLRRTTHYTLTNKRAFIATQPLGKRVLKSYPIAKDTSIELQDGTPATIIFARETHRGNKSSYKTNIGFERISDGQKVYGLLRDIQKEAA